MNMPSPSVSFANVRKNQSDTELAAAIRRVFLEVTGDLAWLKRGDLVLLKPALNSPDPYPATTHPLSVAVVAAVLAERGARVVVGDQSGVEHVVQGLHGVVRGSSRSNFTASGMAGANGHVPSGIEFVGFEEGSWDAGFYKFSSTAAASWPDGFYLTDWVRRADHIINLPRVSTHAQAGVTLGFKNLVGLLREDSRLAFHANGPFNAVIAAAVNGSGLHVADDGRRAFIEKIVEISLAVKDKLRCTLFTATQAQTTFGPDQHTVRSVKWLLNPHIAMPDPGLVFASADPVAAEAYAIELLTRLYQTQTPFADKLKQRLLVAANGRVKELGTEPTAANPFIKHAVALGLGSAATSVPS
jgi:uncharacterized protein (DUF362 family)